MAIWLRASMRKLASLIPAHLIPVTHIDEEVTEVARCVKRYHGSEIIWRRCVASIYQCRIYLYANLIWHQWRGTSLAQADIVMLVMSRLETKYRPRRGWWRRWACGDSGCASWYEAAEPWLKIKAFISMMKLRSPRLMVYKASPRKQICKYR